MNFDDLIEKKLIQIRRHEYLPLSIYRYGKKVFWDGLFENDIRFRFARGLAIDDDGRVIVRPFFKVYNLGENDAGLDWDDDYPVLIERKVNGFMACATRYMGELIYSTTGTFDSDYAEMAKRYIEDQCNIEMFLEGRTYIFEVCAKEDPHIIDEKIGVYLLAIMPNDEYARSPRHKLYDDFSLFSSATQWYHPWQVSNFYPSNPGACVKYHEYVSDFAKWLGAHPVEKSVTRFGEAKKLVKEASHEGYMITALTNEVPAIRSVIKAKSPLYLSTKFFARYRLRGDEDPEVMKKRVDEEYYPLLDRVFKEDQSFFELEEQDRIAYVRDWASSNL